MKTDTLPASLFVFWTKRNIWNIKMEQASTVRCLLMIIVDTDHADIDHKDKSLVVILQPML